MQKLPPPDKENLTTDPLVSNVQIGTGNVFNVYIARGNHCAATSRGGSMDGSADIELLRRENQILLEMIKEKDRQINRLLHIVKAGARRKRRGV